MKEIEIFSVSPLRTRKCDNYSDRNQENKQRADTKKTAKKIRMITLLGAIEKSPILLSKYWKINNYKAP